MKNEECRRWCSHTTTCRLIKSDMRSCFYTIEGHGKDPEAEKIDSTWRCKENWKISCEMWLIRYKRKSVLHRIVTGDEKWVYFENIKHKRFWLTPGEPLISVVRSNCYGRKTMLCVCRNQKGAVYCEILRLGETVLNATGNNLDQALRETWPEYQERHHKVTLLAKPVKKTIEGFRWETLPHVAYSPHLATSDYYLFTLMRNVLAEHRFSSYESGSMIGFTQNKDSLAWNPEMGKIYS